MSSFKMIKKLAGDSFIYGISGVVSRFISVFLVPVYTRIFTPQDYGIIGLVTTLFALLSILVILGLDNSVARWYYDDESEESQKTAINTFLWSCLATSLIFAIVIILFHGFIANYILKEAATGQVLLIAALNLPLTVFSTFTSYVLRIQRRAVYSSVFSLVTALTTIALNVVFVVVIRTGVIGVFYAQLCTSVLMTVWTFIIFKNLISPRYFNWQMWKEMFKFSFPLIPGSIAFWVINLSGVYFIQSFKNASEVGLYQIGSSLASAMAMLTTAFQMAWGPFAFSISKQSDAKRIYAQALNLYVGLTCLVAVFITLFSREVLSILTTKDYLGAYWVAGILAFNYLIIGLGYIASIGTSLAKNNKMYGIASLASAGLLILLNIILVPRLGKEGAAMSTLMSQLIIPIAIFWHSQKLYPIPYNFLKVLIIFFSSLTVGFGTLFLIQHVSFEFYSQLAVKIGVSILTLGIVIYVLRDEISLAKGVSEIEE